MAVSFSWRLAGAEAVVVPVWQVKVLCLNVSFSVFPSNANPNIKLNKNQKYPKLMYEVLVMCSLHLCSDK